MFNIELAGISIGLNDRYGLLYDHCKDYLTDRPALFEIQIDDKDIHAELEKREEGAPESPAVAEIICVYRAICRILPTYNVFLFHCAALEFDGKAYLFSAPSGTGKSTHLGLWRKNLKDRISIINGDAHQAPAITDSAGYQHTPGSLGKAGLNPLCAFQLP